MKDARDMAGKVAVITGAGSGMGRAAAFILSKRGASVVVNDINPESAPEVCKNLVSLGGDSMHFVADVADTAGVRAMFDAVAQRYGRVDYLVCNAGYADGSLIEEMTDQAWDRMIGVHLGGVFKCIRAGVPLMKKAGGGAIVCTSSTYGMVGWEGWTHYSAAKAGIMGLVKSLARELSPFGIRVNAVAPGSVMTPIQGDTPMSVLRERATTIPLRRIAEPEEVARVMAFLLSDEASFITGQVVSPNGGAIIVGI
ncbi:MAG: SDR family NAD(P)-dependent oxidoreductase [Ignavibacteriales bacterium]